MNGMKTPLTEVLAGRALGDLPFAAAVVGPDGRIQAVNAAYSALTGFEASCLVGQTAPSFIEDSGFGAAERTDALVGGRGFHAEARSIRVDGSAFWSRIAVVPLRGDDGAVTSYLTLHEDISDVHESRRVAARATAASNILLSVAAALGPAHDRDSVARLLAQAVVDAGAPWAGVLLDGLAGRWSATASHGTTAVPMEGLAEDRSAVEGLLDPAGPDVQSAADLLGSPARWMRDHGFGRLARIPFRTKIGTRGVIVSAWLDASPPTAEDEQFTIEHAERLRDLGVISLDNVALIERVRLMAERDALTGALSRASLLRRFEEMLERGTDRFGVVYLDVDRFKRINDSLGHRGGDELLRQLHGRLAGALEPGDVVSRLGGDEFVLLLAGERLPQRIDLLKADLAESALQPFVIAGRDVYVACSVGASIGEWRAGETAAEAADRLIDEADTAMYLVKAERRRWRRVDAAFDEVVLEADLYRAVDRGEISAHFQPQYSARTGRLVGYEALARWTHPRLGAIPPDVFIPIAERGDLLEPVGGLILDAAFAFAEAASARGPIQIDINFSSRQMQLPDFVGQISARLAAYPDRTWAVTAEIAEFDLVAEDALVDTLHALRELDIDIAIDHFGSGTSSLALLQRLPVTAVKIDKSIVRHEGALGTGMITAIVNLARSLGLEIMGDGIDTAQQLEVLEKHGCERMQGFSLVAPLPHDVALLAPQTSREALQRARR